MSFETGCIQYSKNLCGKIIDEGIAQDYPKSKYVARLTVEQKLLQFIRDIVL